WGCRGRRAPPRACRRGSLLPRSHTAPMAILERIGLAPKRGRRPRWSGLKLEGRSAQAQERLSRRAVWARVGLLAGLVGLTLLAFNRKSTRLNSSHVKISYAV